MQLIVARFLSYFGSVFTPTFPWSLRSTFALVLSFLCKLPKSCGFDPFATFSMPWLGLPCCMCVFFILSYPFWGWWCNPDSWPFCVAVSTAFIRPITTQCSTLIFTLCEGARMVSGRDWNGEGRTEEKTTKNQTCTVMDLRGGAHGEGPLPTVQNVLNFMQFFFGKFGKIAWCSLPPSPLRVGAPSYWNAGSSPAVRKQLTWNEDGLKHLSLFAIVHCNDINLFSQ